MSLLGPAGSDFDLPALVRDARRLADQGVRMGTSSWKYPGWCGTLYDEQRYLHHGRFSTAKFERECLAEYASCLPTVGVDASYYTLPDPQRTARMFETALAVNPEFQFGFKVTDCITARHFPRLARHGPRAGRDNPDFLDVGLFRRGFLDVLEPWREHVGPLMFEFSTLHKRDFERGRDFLDALDGFLAELPTGWHYAVEVRNPSLLQPEYFDTLARHGVAHVFTSWHRMPPLAEQLRLSADSGAEPPFGCARLLLKPGRAYQQAVDAFAPYTELREPQAEVRAAATDWIRELLQRPGAVTSGGSTTGKRPRRAWIYVNNRLEGHAPGTLAALIKASHDARSDSSPAG